MKNEIKNEKLSKDGETAATWRTFETLFYCDTFYSNYFTVFGSFAMLET